jgi:uncharacterized membrane protein HdeD (DUF308 family)
LKSKGKACIIPKFLKTINLIMSKRTNSVKQASMSPKEMLFSKQNYLLVGIGVALIVVGFFMMYMENEIDGFISLYIAPVLIMAGFGEIVYAIMKKSSSENQEA